MNGEGLLRDIPSLLHAKWGEAKYNSNQSLQSK